MKRSASEFPQIPDKIYFRIGEVSQLVGVDTHVLRYWESEFAIVKPFRGPSKQRLYRRQDVENLLRIKNLLHEEGYTISGARKYLRNIVRGNLSESGADAGGSGLLDDTALIGTIKQELQAILAQLSNTKKNDS